jgi:hypothetical protein
VRPLVALGEASFALYIVQFPANALLPTSIQIDGSVGRYPAFFVFLIALSLVLHHVVERPLRSLLQPGRGEPLGAGRPSVITARDALSVCAFVAVGLALGAAGVHHGLTARRAALAGVLDSEVGGKVGSAQPLDLSLGAPEGQRFLREGWSGNEFDVERQVRWVWAVGRASVLVVPLEAGRGHVLTIDLAPFIVPGRTQTLEIVVNGTTLTTLTLAPGLETRVVTLPGSVVRAENRIELRYAYAMSPKQLGISNDVRDLAIVVQRITLGPL